MTRFFLPSAAACCLLMAGFAGCSPQPGAGRTDDIIEIEEIEMAPQPGEPAAESGADARRAVDAEKAAADKAIDEAARSIDPPPAAADARSEPESAAQSPPEPTANQ